MKKAKIHYFSLTDEMRKEEKLQWFSENRLQNISFDIIRPDKNANWINLSDNDFEMLLPLMDKDVKAGKKEEAIFELFSRGVETGRDEWVYDFSKERLQNKIEFFTKKYNTSIDVGEKDMSIKWNTSLDGSFSAKNKVNFNENLVKMCLYRPFSLSFHYTEKLFNHRLTQNHYDIFGSNLDKPNIQIIVPGLASPKDFHTIIISTNIDMNCLPAGCQCLPLYRYDSEGNQVENITDWALQQFTDNYTDDSITKEDIFHYVYSVLHNPIYREKYETNLKREFPRIPFYTDFHKWVAWGKKLMDLHINYESVEPYPLVEKTIEKETPKAKLKAIKETGEIVLDESTSLLKVPIEVYEYKLGNRSAVEWILDQYKESKPTDPTIAEKFNTYKFADYKTEVIELLKRVCTVSIETMEIISEMNT